MCVARREGDEIGHGIRILIENEQVGCLAKIATTNQKATNTQ